MKKIRVLHITNAFPNKNYSAYGIFIKDQIDSLPEEIIENEVFFINARNNGFLEYIKSAGKIKALINEFQPEIIHLHHEFSLIPLLFLRKKHKLLLSVLGDLSKRKWVYRLLFKILSRRADGIIFKNRLPSTDKEFYLPNGVDTEHFKPISKQIGKRKLGLDNDRKYILFVSAKAKNPVKRFDKFKAILENIRMDDNSVQELVMTNISREDAPYYYNSCELLLVTSEEEGSPNSVKEAMACNIPVVSTDVGNVRAMLQFSNKSAVVTSGTVLDLQLETQKIISSKTYCNNRQLLIDTRLTKEAISEKLINIYQIL